MQQTSSVDLLTDGLGDLLTYLKRTAKGDILADVMELDLSLSQVRALFIAERAVAPPAVHELAAELGLSMAATGRAVDALVRHGLVVRYEDSGDRRVKRIRPTPEGRELATRLSAAHQDDLRRFAEALTEEERAGLVKALAPILTRPDVRAQTTIGPHC